MNWYEIKNLDTIDSPALVLYKERIAANIRLLKGMVKDDLSMLRPHVKTNKIKEVCRMMMDEGVQKFKCATIAEAEMLAMIGATDVLLAYQPVGPKVKRYVELIRNYPDTRFSCLLDNIQSAERLSETLVKAKAETDVFIDLNTGMNRTGIIPTRALLLFEGIELLPALNLVGLHAYDGHIRDTGVASRTGHVAQGFAQVPVIAAAIESVTGRQLTIVAGGSPTFPMHAQRARTECSPGTFVFWDHGYKTSFPDEPFDYAALLITRIICVVDETTVTSDLGHKSVAAENPLPRVWFLNAPNAVPVSQSEEHLVLKVPDASVYVPGDILYGVPVHICPTVALYERAIVIEDHLATAEWQVIARDKKIGI